MNTRLYAGLIALLIVLAGCAAAPPRQTQPTVPTPPPVEVPAVVQAPVAATPVIKLPAGEAPGAQISSESPRVEAVPLPAEPLTDIVVLALPKEDLWVRIRAGFSLAELPSPLVKNHETWYASRPDYVQRMTERSQLYLFHIVEEVERRRLPAEIALLPMIESAFNPKAYSRSHASGIWQFIPSTGKHFGLDQNWWYDGRRDVLDATNAALDYLERLHKRFGSWELALAAYNCGEGTVARAIKVNVAKGLPTDYLSLKLPAESRHYVPKLMAVKNIIANPQAFDLQLNDVPNEPFFTAVEISKHIDVALAARFADMTVDEFIALNPAYNKPVITFNDSERLLLPTSKAVVFTANLRRYGNRQLHTWQAYQAKRGERIDKIAAKFGIGASELRNLNRVREKRGKLASPQLLLVPLRPNKPLPTAEQIAAAQLVPPPLANVIATMPETYLVQKGDTLFSLAKRFGTSVDVLLAENQLANGNVEVGETINIPIGHKPPGGEAAVVVVKNEAPQVQPPVAPLFEAGSAKAPVKRAQSAATTVSFYVVKRGDTLSSIARAFGVAVADVMRWNGFDRASKLLPGIRVKIFPSLR